MQFSFKMIASFESLCTHSIILSSTGSYSVNRKLVKLHLVLKICEIYIPLYTMLKLVLDKHNLLSKTFHGIFEWNNYPIHIYFFFTNI
jgi:hypothetical protein